jgi:hypothetical protein
MFVLVMVLDAAALMAAEVRMGSPIRSLVPTMQHLRDQCGVSGAYDACTRFVAWKLEAGCEREGEEWRMRPTAAFTPWIVLYNIRQLSHELEHIKDVRQWTEAYAVGLERLRFASDAECRARTLQESGGFEATIRGFAAASNALHHPLAYAKR